MNIIVIPFDVLDEAVILYSKMLQLSKPPPGYVRDLNKALEDKCVHHVWNVLNPRTNNPFTDVVAVSPFDDPLTRFIAASPLSIFFVVSIFAKNLFSASYLQNLGLDRVVQTKKATRQH